MNVLLVVYDFPPSSKIGARRWGKFYTELKRHCSEVYVLTHCNAGNTNSNMYFFKSGYPKILDTSPDTIFEKFFYKLAILKQKIFTKGSLYDKTALLEAVISSRLSEVVSKHNIDTVIVSGAPFSLTYFVVKALKRFPKVRSIVDFRDPWTWANAYGFETISKKRRIREEEMERFVIENCNLVTVPSEMMARHINQNYTVRNIYTLPHGFQKELFDLRENLVETPDRIKLIYGGTIYSDLKEEFESLFNLIVTEDLNIEVSFFTNSFKYRVPETLSKLSKKIRVEKPLSEQLFFKELVNADYYLLIYPDQYKDFISSKFFEIIYAKIPIILIANEGLVSEFVVKNGLGVHFQSSNFEKEFVQFIKQPKKFSVSATFPIEDFEYSNITRKFIEYLEDIQ